MNKHDIYVQAINYPTVARGSERLRVAPTPHHTKAMMDYFVSSVIRVWSDNGLELSRERSVCPDECEVCNKPLGIQILQAEEKVCGRSNCTYASLQDIFFTDNRRAVAMAWSEIEREATYLILDIKNVVFGTQFSKKIFIFLITIYFKITYLIFNGIV